MARDWISMIKRVGISIIVVMVFILPLMPILDFTCVSAAEGEGVVHTVKPGMSLQDAIYGANANDVIEILEGEYGDVSISVDKSLTIRAKADGVGFEVVNITTTLIVAANDVSVEGLRFKGIKDHPINSDWDDWFIAEGKWGSWDFAGIITRQEFGRTNDDGMISNLKVSNCTFDNNQAGVFLFGAKYCLVEDCTFINNRRGVTIRPHYIEAKIVWSSHNNTISGCEFIGQNGSGAEDGEGVAIQESNDCIVKECTMKDNSYGVGITGGKGNQILNNEISDSYFDALFLNYTNNSVITSNRIIDNSGDVVITGCEDIRIASNRFVGSSLLLDASVQGNVSENKFEKTNAPSVRVTGDEMDHYDHEFSRDNTIYEGRDEGDPIIYIFNGSGEVVKDPRAGAIMVAFSDGVSILGTKVDGGDGLWLYRSDDCRVTDSTVNGCIYGIKAEQSDSLTVKDTVITATSRSWQAVHMVGGTSDWYNSEIRTVSYANAFKLEEATYVSTYNTTFNDSKVDVKGSGTLKVHFPLTIKTLKNNTTEPFPGVHIKVTQDDNDVYKSTYYGGNRAVTDADGLAGTESHPIYLLDHEFIDSSTQTNHHHDLEVYAKVTAEWSNEALGLDMSGPVFIVFEVADIGSPPPPMDIELTDLPDEDSIELSWTDVGGDVSLYSIYWNGTGEWTLLANVSAPGTSYRVEERLEDQRTYWFSISSWDDVPLESPRTSPKGVKHTVNNHRPGLTEGAVDPPVNGTTRTEFLFSVVFTDADGDEGTIWVVIDGERHEMKGNKSDTDSMDGRLYTYKTKLGKGNHAYHFEADDTGGLSATGPYAGPSGQQTLADVEKVDEPDSPGMGVPSVLAGMAVVALFLLGSRRRR